MLEFNTAAARILAGASRRVLPEVEAHELGRVAARALAVALSDEADDVAALIVREKCPKLDAVASASLACVLAARWKELSR